ncbi:REP element-mobilizing transposase RayT [Geobacter argillaceus]|uniref:REP element-mobilizing transposase RayT n=1 Tax=Geobacter argillaceus TaxID=345631 RepID=A0A562WRX4_9BACT|nr:REP element-mobilizing transposase RayT [Geobacter argillaceus]
MPRSARIDIPGLLQHVIVRGIERRDIFLDDDDKALFIERLSKLLIATGTDCLAWALMSNHFHLLLRPRATKLSVLMRRLLTGYAVVFNLRHHRSGHLFQNRYKSIVCEEDAYLLELVRYIHLNPLRVGLVDSLDDLDSYKWSGHAVIMGKGAFAGQNEDELLLMFGNRKGSARKKYRSFIEDGIRQGKRDELVGGGLRRSRNLSGSEEYEAYDERILGSGAFVERLQQEPQTSAKTGSVSLEVIIRSIAHLFSIEPVSLRQGGKRKELSDARGALCYIAVIRMGLNGASVARALNISRAGVSLAARRGEEIYKMTPALHDVEVGLQN